MTTMHVQPLFEPSEGPFVDAIAALAYVNPFLPERDAAERLALGDNYDDTSPSWVLEPSARAEHHNITAMTRRTSAIVEAALARLEAGATPTPEELASFETLALFHLYHHFRAPVVSAIEAGTADVPFYETFAPQAERLLHAGGQRLPGGYDPPHVLAYIFQVGRAFHHISQSIHGRSAPAIALRAEIWQSIFTHDLRRYLRALSGRMSEISTLITGPSGTGKELVARAIGLSGYIPFDARTQSFRQPFHELFRALNLSALSTHVIEAELFGYRRGAFTGATEDRRGWFDAIGPLGTVFLDEIGEIEASIQVKLLRVLQTRTFHRLGDTRERTFEGKVMCATNRDLAAEMRAGRFREDLFYRICSDRIVTPSLADQLRDAPDELEHLVAHVTERLAGADEAERLTAEAVTWIAAHLPDDYAWPGNFRELEQCVRNIMIRGRYEPAAGEPVSSDPLAPWVASIRRGEHTAEELLAGYCTLVYSIVGSYEGAARALGIDRRTVKAKLDNALLARLRSDVLQ